MKLGKLCKPAAPAAAAPKSKIKNSRPLCAETRIVNARACAQTFYEYKLYVLLSSLYNREFLIDFATRDGDRMGWDTPYKWTGTDKKCTSIIIIVFNFSLFTIMLILSYRLFIYYYVHADSII